MTAIHLGRCDLAAGKVCVIAGWEVLLNDPPDRLQLFSVAGVLGGKPYHSKRGRQGDGSTGLAIR